MNERRYRLTQQALDDLSGIAAYIGQHSPSAADRVIDSLIDAFVLLGNNPALGTNRDDLRPGLRTFSPLRPAQSYVVLFYRTRDGVEINSVIHGARDWPSLISGRDR